MLASIFTADHARLSRLAALGACAVAALLCLWLLVRLAWLLVPQDDDVASAPAASVPAAVPMQSVGKWHLFGNPQQIAVLQQMRNAPATTLKLTLRGTLAMDDAHDGIAMIEDERGGERAFKVGEAVGSNAKLAAVYADHVVLDHEGVAETLNLPRAEQHVSALSANPASPAPTAAARASSIPPNYAPPQLGGNLDWNAAQSKLRIDPAQLAKQVHVEPVFENGRIAGARLSGGGEVARLMGQAGLKPTDLITAINGQALSAVSNPQQFMDNLAGAGSLSVTVLRDGKPATLTVSLH